MEALIENIETSEERYVPEFAIQHLPEFGPLPLRALQTLGKSLQSDNRDLQKAAAASISKLEIGAPSLVAALVEAADVDVVNLQTLGRWGEWEALVGLVRDHDDYDVREGAVGALIEETKQNAKVIPRAVDAMEFSELKEVERLSPFTVPQPDPFFPPFAPD